jgi:hypothetical protein
MPVLTKPAFQAGGLSFPPNPPAGAVYFYLAGFRLLPVALQRVERTNEGSPARWCLKESLTSATGPIRTNTTKASTDKNAR